MTRVPLPRALTKREAEMVELLLDGMSRAAIARHLGLSIRTVHQTLWTAASKVPGTLDAKARLVAWARGASLEVLTGESGTLPSRIALLG